MKINYLQLIVLVLMFKSVSAQNDTITELSNLTNQGIFKAPNGKIYHVAFESEEQSPGITSRGGIKHNTSAGSGDNKTCDHANFFDGVYRKKAKTSIAKHMASGTNLAKLITRLNAIDKNSIHVTSSSERIEIEDSIVTLISVYLYAIARESDEDYHIIIGTSDIPTKAKFFNIECSGLSKSNSIVSKQLKNVRKELVGLLGGTERCQEGYILFKDHHPKVRIVGSLFYDKEHESNIPGPSSCKPESAWELHPITQFKVL